MTEQSAERRQEAAEARAAQKVGDYSSFVRAKIAEHRAMADVLEGLLADYEAARGASNPTKAAP